MLTTGTPLLWTLFVAFVFSESLYGAGVALRWDHKTVFSVLSWATFAALLLGRAQFGNLHVVVGNEHKHEAQKPRKIDLNSIK